MKTNGRFNGSPPQRHINSYIHSIISLIKTSPHAISFDTIRKDLNINLYQNPLILTALRKNPKIIIENESVLFKPTYEITCKLDIKKEAEKTNNAHGIEMNELKDCPGPIDTWVNELVKENMLYMIKDADGSFILFNNDLQMVSVENAVQEMWNRVKIPDYEDLRMELKSAGLKSGSEVKKRRVVVEVKKKPRRGNRKIKLTNTHVKDLNLDF